MSPELIGVIGSTIALGSVLFAAIRGVKSDLRTEISGLGANIQAGDTALREEIVGLRADIQAGDTALREEIAGLRADMQAGDGSLRAEMKAGFGELNTRVGAVEQRLSKVEGVIEGIFWSNRNEPPEKPREGAA